MSNEEDGISSQELYARLWRRRTWIGATTIFFTAVSIAIAFLMTPIYRATTVLVPTGAERNKIGALSSTLWQFGGLSSLAVINLATGDIETQEALADLHSRGFTQAFIPDDNFMP